MNNVSLDQLTKVGLIIYVNIVKIRWLGEERKDLWFDLIIF
jgi:hypothetical protein